MSELRVAVICDLREEEWPSMDLAADMLLDHLASDHSHAVAAERIQPIAKRRFSNPPDTTWRWSVDRLLNRFWDYPRVLRTRVREFDVHHIVDHSYSQLVHSLPTGRTVVTCHDLDTFRSVLRPSEEKRSAAFRVMTWRILRGFVRAGHIVCVSETTRNELESFDLVPSERISVVRNGVHPDCTPREDPVAARALEEWLGPPMPETIELLHVGSTIPRKRIDLLLGVLADLRRLGVRARLLRVGGEFTKEQRRMVTERGLDRDIVVLPRLSRPLVAEIYRRAALLLQTSEQEGFGLPVAEALACGTPVVVSDIPVMREVAGDAGTFCSLETPGDWAAEIVRLLDERKSHPAEWNARRIRGIEWADRYSWANHAREMVDVYRRVAGSPPRA